MSDKNKESFAGLSSSIDPVVFDRPPTWKRTKTLAIGFCLSVLATGGFILQTIIPTRAVPELHNIHAVDDLCPQAKLVTPVKHSAIWDTLMEKSASDEFKKHAVKWLSEAIQIETVSYDDMGPVGEDSRWDVYGPFQEYLRKTFPLVHSHANLSLTKINTWGLLYEWAGSNEGLRPILLLAHQDVVPVNPETEDEWNYPSFSGHYDGENVWGRGSGDDKTSLIGILAAMENLLSVGFNPARTVVLAFGFDEEIGGQRGARKISEYLLSIFGEQTFAFVVDEGGIFVDAFGSVVALPAVTEKGYMDVHMSVASPGGHASIPPEHTSIGFLAALIVDIEANPMTPRLLRTDVFYDTLLCAAVHSTEIDPDLKNAILASVGSDAALVGLESAIFKIPAVRSLVGTTAPVTTTGGGVKINALPEDAWATINHRIATQSSVAEVKGVDTYLAQSVAVKFNLSLTAFGKVITDPSVPYFGAMELSNPSEHSVLEPAPVSPYKGSAAYDVLSGTIKSVYNTHRGLEGDNNINVYPFTMPANTDTRHYWKLSENIYRYNHVSGLNGRGLGNIHTVNEYVYADSVVEIIEFYTTLILNADEAHNL